jgi:hypothetical protein
MQPSAPQRPSSADNAARTQAIVQAFADLDLSATAAHNAILAIGLHQEVRTCHHLHGMTEPHLISPCCTQRCIDWALRHPEEQNRPQALTAASLPPAAAADKGELAWALLKGYGYDESIIAEAMATVGNDVKTCIEFIRARQNPLQPGFAGQVEERFRAMGMSIEQARARAIDAVKRTSTLHGAVTWAYANSASPDIQIKCPVLGEEVAVGEAFLLDCPKSHKESLDAALQSIEVFVGRESVLPTCPGANRGDAVERCNYVMSVLEIEQVLCSRLCFTWGGFHCIFPAGFAPDVSSWRSRAAR